MGAGARLLGARLAVHAMEACLCGAGAVAGWRAMCSLCACCAQPWLTAAWFQRWHLQCISCLAAHGLIC